MGVIQLAWRQARREPHALLASGSTCAAAVLSFTMVTAMQTLETESGTVEDRQGGFGTVWAFTTLALVSVIASISSLTVRAERRAYARQMTLGMTPRHVCSTLLIRASLSSLGGALGAAVAVALLAGPITAGFVETGLLQLSPETDDLVSVMARSWVRSALAVTVVAVGSSIPAALSASRTDPSRALHEHDSDPLRRSTAPRWIAATTLIVVTATPVTALLLVIDAAREWGRANSALLGDDAAEIQRLLALSPGARLVGIQATLSLTLVVAVAILMPILARRLVLTWSALVPARWSATWFIARKSTAERVGVTSSTLTVSATLLGIVASVQSARDLARLLGVEPGSGWGETLGVLGPPGLVALVGGAAALTIDRTTEIADARVLNAVGTTSLRFRQLSLCRTLIYTLTPVFPALLVWFAPLALGVLLAPAVGAAIEWGLPDFRPLLAATVAVGLAHAIALRTGPTLREADGRAAGAL